MINGLFLGIIIGLVFGALIAGLCLLSCWKDAEHALHEEIELYEKRLKLLQWDLDYLDRKINDVDKSKKPNGITPDTLSSIRRTYFKTCPKCKQKK